MNISRKSALKTIGTALGITSLFGLEVRDAADFQSQKQESPKTKYNVGDYGAAGDGQTDDTQAINDTITAAAEAGGGTVAFPAGTYLSGSVHLKSNIGLQLGQGAILQATDNPSSYDDPEPLKSEQYQDFGHSHWHNSLIWGENLQNIGITGPGMIWGKGLLREEAEDKSEEGLGNKTIALKKCHNVILKDFIIKHGGWIGTLATGVDNLTIDNLTIDTSRDGINIDSCRSVQISNCNINCPYDDAICLKSSYALGYAQATQGIAITNCTISGFKEGTLLGGSFEPRKENDKPVRGHGRIKFGTESNGGFKNIAISNCTFEHCRGLALETVDGGLLEDISISNISMCNIKNAPIFLRLGRRMRGPDGVPVGHLRRINISNILVHNADYRAGLLVSGIPNHPIEDIKINNIQFQHDGGGTREMVAINPPEIPEGYPDPKNFGKMPSYGIYLRHVDGIEVTNAKFSYIEKDARPPFVLDDVTDVDFRFIKTQLEPNTPTFSLNSVNDFRVFGADSVPDSKLKNVRQKKI